MAFQINLGPEFLCFVEFVYPMPPQMFGCVNELSEGLDAIEITRHEYPSTKIRIKATGLFV